MSAINYAMWFAIFFVFVVAVSAFIIAAFMKIDNWLARRSCLRGDIDYRRHRRYLNSRYANIKARDYRNF